MGPFDRLGSIALVALAMVVGVQGFSLPIVSVQAQTHWEVGAQVGFARREQLQSYFADPSTALHTRLLPFFKTTEGKAYVNELRRNADEHYPEYMEELRGMAHAADLDFDSVFVLNCESEIGLLAPKPGHLGVHCTDVLVPSLRNPDGFQSAWIGHNEDYSPEMIDQVFLLNATIDESEESFVSFIYPGTLPGWAFSMNQHGVAVTANAVFPKVVGRNASVPLVFAARRAIAASSVEQAKQWLNSLPLPLSGGIALNMADGHGPQGNVASVELAHPIVTTRDITADREAYFFHFNQYRHNPMLRNETIDESSVARSNAANELLHQNKDLLDSTDGILKVLGDTQDPELPIFRTGNKDNIFTLATALFDANHGTLDVWTANPRFSAPTYRFPKPSRFPARNRQQPQQTTT
mmetsp:Transcript_15758/g.28026  ORF Transcript_15758/g.28026 Transcript_15758/m.28026 type:complete len:409 (+) Transcript_15758:448-1674(+)